MPQQPLPTPSLVTGSHVIGLTGSIGSGKSAASSAFARLGAAILDSDIIAREVVAPGPDSALPEIVARFGQAILTPEGALDRQKLGGIVFTDPRARADLEKITHPRIRKRFLDQLAATRQLSPAPRLIVAVIPLLFESSSRYPELEKVVVVTAREDLCLQRISSRDHCTPAAAEQKLRSQLPLSLKEQFADFLLENNTTTTALGDSVKALMTTLEGLTNSEWQSSRFHGYRKP